MTGPAPILVAIERWNPAGGGRERYGAELAAALARRGHAVSIACAGADAPAEYTLDAHGSVTRLRAAVGRWRAAHPGAPAVSLFPMADATHVQLHSGLVACAASAERDAFGPGMRRLLFTPAGTLNHRRRRRLRDESAMGEPDAPSLMTFSRHDADALATIHAMDRARITVARPGVDVRRFTPAAGGHALQPGAPLRVMFAGHNFRLKGLARALDAIARARRPVTLTIAGHGQRAPYEWRARFRRISARVRFCGTLSQDALVRAFQSSDVLLHPAYYDPFPRAVVEAMACGCVPIVTRQCGVSEVLTGGVDGFVAGDPAATADMAAWLDALGDVRMRSTMREAAIRLARTLDFESHADEVVSWIAR